MASWQVIRRLGEGGAGEVFLAVTPEGGKVAVKVLKDPAFGSLLEREAGILVKLRHPAVAPLLGFSKNSSDVFGADRGPCFWMEYVGGEDLLAAAHAAKRSRPKIEGWLVQALEALEFLHAQDVLHGDLSPANVRIDDEGKLKLIDFGMANFRGQAGAFNAATVMYLAPERVGGKSSPASDLFSLGTLFYEALAGAHPREGALSLRDMVRRPAKPLLEARPDLASHALLARVIDRMILADPVRRFARASEALEALRGGVKTEAVSSPYYPVRLAGEAGRWAAAAEEAIGRLEERSRFFALHGVGGTGKKRFLGEIVFHATLAGRPVREWEASRFREGMAALASSTGLTVFRHLEDVAPADLARVLHLRRRQLPAAGLMVVWEWNEDKVGEEVRRVLEGLSAHPDVDDARLTNLDENDAVELVRSALGEDAASSVGRELHRLTAGNPASLLEFISVLRERGPGDWVGAVRALKGAGDILSDRASGLPSPERRLVELLAAAHWSVELDDLLRADGGEPEAVFVSLDRLSSKGLVKLETATGRYRLATDGLEASVLRSIDEAKKREWHASWWKALAGSRDEDPQKLHHAVALGESGFVARVAPAVAESLRGKRVFEDALRSIGEALSSIGGKDPVARSKLLRVKGNVLNDLGRYREAFDVAEEVFALAAADEPTEVKTVKYWLVTGLIRQNLGDRADAERRFSRLLEEARRFGAAVPAFYALRALVLLGVEALRRGEFPAARKYFEEGLLSSEAKGWRRAEILRNLAAVHHHQGDAKGASGFLETARELYREEKNAEGEYAAWLEEGNLSLDRKDFAAAESAYARAEAIAQERDDGLLLAGLWNNQGVMERKRGDLGRSLERLQSALALFRPLGNAADLAECLKQNALTDAQVGRFEAAASKIAEIRSLAGRFPDAEAKAGEAEEELRLLRDGVGAPSETDEKTLKQIYDRLPKTLQVSFEERFDYKQSVSRRNS